jgi:hypothetical protein
MRRSRVRAAPVFFHEKSGAQGPALVRISVMTRRIVHQLVDDIDGTVLEVGSGETVLFSIDGAAYEIDLTNENAATLRDVLAPYVSAGRPVSARSASSSSSRSGSRGGNSGGGQRRTGQRDYAPIRAWAAKNGYEVSERGRIPASVLEAYDAAH